MTRRKTLTSLALLLVGTAGDGVANFELISVRSFDKVQ